GPAPARLPDRPRDGPPRRRPGDGPAPPPGDPRRRRGRPHPARVRAAGVPAPPQERRRDARHARPGRLARAGPRPHQRHRRLHQPPPPQGGRTRPAFTHPHAPRRRLQPAGASMSLSIRWRLTLWNALALTVGLVAFSVLVYSLLAHALYEQVDAA